MSPIVLIAAACAVLISAITPLVVRPLLRRRNVIDVPNARSSHSTPTLRGGGISVLIGLVSGLGVANIGAGTRIDSISILVIGGSAVAAGGVGLVEDLRGLRVTLRAVCQLVIALAASIAMATFVAAPWWAVMASTILIAGYINVANFMDGVNAISALHGLVAGVAFVAMGVVTASDWLQFAGAVIAAAFMGFLPWNLIPPGMFLGDIGSYVLGAAVATTAVAAWFAGAPVVTAISPLVIYLADTGVTLLRRVLKREKWYEAHRTHTYQRLTDAGLSHLGVASAVAAFSAICAAIGLVALFVSSWAQLLLGVVLALVALAYLQSPRLLARARVGG